jgi:hypothetical protein
VTSTDEQQQAPTASLQSPLPGLDTQGDGRSSGGGPVLFPESTPKVAVDLVVLTKWLRRP